MKKIDKIPVGRQKKQELQTCSLLNKNQSQKVRQIERQKLMSQMKEQDETSEKQLKGRDRQAFSKRTLNNDSEADPVWRQRFRKCKKLLTKI